MTTAHVLFYSKTVTANESLRTLQYVCTAARVEGGAFTVGSIMTDVVVGDKFVGSHVGNMDEEQMLRKMVDHLTEIHADMNVVTAGAIATF